MAGCELDDARGALLGRPTEAQVQHRKLFLQVGREQDDGRSRSGVVDGGAVDAQQAVGKAVAHLRVHVRCAHHVVAQPGPCVGVLVGATRTTDDGDTAGTTTLLSRIGSALTIAGGAVTVGTNNDKTGYSLSAAGVQAIWDALTSALTTVGSIGT